MVLVLVPLILLALAAVPSLPADAVRLEMLGLGRYRSAPALFLAKKRGESFGQVLPVPVPLDSVMGIEMALAGPRKAAMLEVLLHGRGIANRDSGIFDTLPWEWNSSPQAKRDGFSRFTGRGYPRAGYASPFHLCLDLIRRDACADVSGVLIEDTDLLGSMVLGGTLLVERRRPAPEDDSGAFAMGAGPAPAAKGGGPTAETPTQLAEWNRAEPKMCACTTDEALGLAIALGCPVHVELAVWEIAAQQARYTLQRGKMRLDVEREPAAGAAVAGPAARPPPAVLPWEIRSASELQDMPLEAKARSALAAGLRLPRKLDATEQVLLELLAPLLDETVRRELDVEAAAGRGDWAAAAALEAASPKRSRLTQQLRSAVAQEKYGEAAELAMQLRVETARRADVTQEEGSYSRFLDQDDWYAQQLAREREALLRRDAELEREREEKAAAAEADAAKKAAAAATAAEKAAETAAAKAAETAAAKAAQEGAATRDSDLTWPGVGSDAGARSGGLGSSAFGSGLSSGLFGAARGAQPAADTDWTPELEATVSRWMVNAFDNLPPTEVNALLGALVSAAPRAAEAERSLRKLAAISQQLESLEAGVARGGSGWGERAVDELRTLRSQLRMWGKDGEKYLRDQGGEPGSWLGWLESIRPK